ncbi:hypothetical protein [Archaeoglobus fulgidus]|uniref:hypothetical protein n=1 Tax=Archaeoglobus fulgidus TaxID=2234 RepID=UPI001177A65D|nr:hypothetical protein [Archaeoglobus fulgidus]
MMAAGLGILIALLAVPFISEITDKTETLEVEVIGEVVVEDSLSFGGANAGLKSERIFVADKGLVIDGYLFEWQKIKFEIEKDEIILRLPSGRRLPIPYSEELAEMLRKSKTSYFIDTK